MLESPVMYIRMPMGPGPSGIDKGFFDFLLAQSEDTLSRIASEFEQFDGYLSRASRREILVKIVDSPDKIPTYETLLDMGESFLLRSDGIEGLLSGLQEVQKEDEPGKGSVFTPQELTDLKDRFEILLKLFPSRQRQLKAERLATATGLRVESIDLVCDLRPIFDDGRTQVEGLMPLTTLKVVASGVDRFPICFEAILSVKDVESLLDSAKFAVAKLTALGDFAARVNVPIPTVELTKTGQ